MPRYFTLDNKRAEAIAKLAEVTTKEVRDYCLADWPEGSEHQNWLNMAPIEEIAIWVSFGENNDRD